MRIHNLTNSEVFRLLVTSDDGLADDEARRRLSEYGFNEIRAVKKISLLSRFLSQFTHFLAILLWTAAGLAFLSESLNPGEGMLSLGMAIIAVIVINAVFTFIQEYRAEKVIEALQKQLPFKVRAIRAGKQIDIFAREVVPGDVIVVNEGDKVPADARLTESNRVMVNNAPLTGESAARARKDDPFEGEFLDSPNIVFAGTHIMSGTGKAVVFATGMSTEFGKIAHLTSTVEPGLTPLQKEIVRVTRIVAAIAIMTGIFFFAIGLLSGKGFWHNFLFAIGILIANVPEGLLPTVTLSLAMGSQRMAKRNALIKTLSAVETLGSVTYICTDKTGTLTRNIMETRKVWAMDTGEQGINEYRYESNAKLMAVAAFCNNASFDQERYRGDPTEAALLRAALPHVAGRKSARLRELPFDSDRKMMTTLTNIDGELLVLSKGAVEMILPLCTEIALRQGVQPLRDESVDSLMRAYRNLTGEGLRVMAFAFRSLQSNPDEKEDLESGLTFAGLIGLEDPPRPEVAAAIGKCRDAGIRVVMITGDAGLTAAAIARQVGLADASARVIESKEFEAMSDKDLYDRILSGTAIFARMTPRHKMRMVSVLKDEGERIAVTGDGVNDAPALRRADIGIAMGISGTDVAKESADMILLDDNFASIVSAIEEGRAIYENIRKFISYIFASNIPEAVPFIAYVLLSIPLPLTILQILAIDLGTDLFPALALGAEAPSLDVMKQPPRNTDERLLSGGLLARAYLFLGPIEAFAGLFGFFLFLHTSGWHYGDMLPADNVLYLQATTVCMGAIIIAQIGNVFACRSFKESIVSIGFFSNRLVLSGIALELVLAVFIIYTGPGNAFFGTAPVDMRIWLTLVPFGFLLILAEEGRKYLVRRRLRYAS